MLNESNQYYFQGMREKYPNTFNAVFFTTKPGLTMADNYNGLIAYLSALSDATDVPEVRQLIPFSDISKLFEKRCMFLHNATLVGYDGTFSGLSATADEIIAKQSIGGAVTRAYPQSSYLRGAMPVVFQPNFCRPEIRVNNKLINQGLDSSPKEFPNNKGFMGLGLPMNTCINVGLEIENFQNISVWSAYAQYIESETKYQNYPLQMILEFWVE